MLFYEFATVLTFRRSWAGVESGDGFGDGTYFGLTYSGAQALSDPFTGGSFGTAYRLNSMTVPSGGGLQFSMTYASGSQELSQVTMPYGGTLQWAYGAKTLAGNRTQMEVTSRILDAQDGQGNKTYTLSHDDSGDLNRLAPSYRVVTVIRT